MKTLMQWGDKLSWYPLEERQDICKQLILQIPALSRLLCFVLPTTSLLDEVEVANLEKFATLARICCDGNIVMMCRYITNEGYDTIAIKWLGAHYD